MSNPGTAVAKAFQLTGNPTIDGLILKGLMAASAFIAGVIVTWLNAHGFKDPNLNLMIGGAVLSVLSAGAVAVWGVIISKVNQAKAVNAGINLVMSGQAVDTVGHPILTSSVNPAPATTTTAAAIVKDFAPPVVTKS